MFPIKTFIAVGLGLVTFIIFMMTYFTVAPYERVLVTRFGKVVDSVGEGLHFKTPFVNDIVRFRIDIQDIWSEKPVNIYTIDNQEVDVNFNLFYRLPADRVQHIYENITDYKQRLLVIAIDRIKSEMGKVNVGNIAQERGTIRDKIKDVIKRDVVYLGIEVTDFQLTNVEYAVSFKKAVEAAAEAKATVETREQELEQAKKTAERARVEAKGRADAALLEAEAAAKAIELKGKAEAASIEAQAKALAQNVYLTELRKAERWDGKLPTSMLSNVMPFMNVDAVKKGN